MNPEKYNRSIGLLCPTCGGSEFSNPHDEGGSVLVTCTGCGLEISRDDLVHSNTENIDANVKEVGDAIVKDMKNDLAKAFRGNKFIKFK